MPQSTDAPAAARRRRPKDRADRILAAAVSLFAERGYHAVGMDDIGAAVGITGPAVYRHFDDKEAVLIAAAVRSAQRGLDANREAVASVETPEALLDELLGIAISEAIDDRYLARAYYSEARHISPERRAPVRTLERANLGIWLDALAALRDDLAPEHARFMVQAVQGLVLSVADYDIRGSRGTIERVLHSMAISALVATPVDQRADAESAVAQGSGRRIDGGSYQSSRREEILAAAAPLFGEFGFEGIGIDGVGEAAGISGPGVYRHFRKKLDILTEVVLRAAELLAANRTRALSEATSPWHALERLVAGYAEIAANHRHMLAVYMDEAHRLDDEARRAAERSQELYVESLAAVVRDVQDRLTDQEAKAMAHGALGLLHSHVRRPTRFPADQANALLSGMALSAMQSNINDD